MNFDLETLIEIKKSAGVANINMMILLLMFFIAYSFKGQVHVFAGRVKFVSH